MSSAFNTIRRQTILNLLKDAGASEDDVRLVRFMLAKTKLTVRVGKMLSESFQTTVGKFEGDSLSGSLFTLTLAGALNHLRAVQGRPNPPISEQGMPTETEYADDVEFIDDHLKNIEAQFPTIKNVLEEFDLFVNDSKTEKTKIYLESKGKIDEKGKNVVAMKNGEQTSY